MPFRLEVHDVLANDDHAVALVTAFSSRGGESLEDRAAQVFHVKGGKISEFWGSTTDPEAVVGLTGPRRS